MPEDRIGPLSDSDDEPCFCGTGFTCLARHDEPCEHPSLTGVDQTDGPDKVWRCDFCGALTRWEVIDGPLGRHVPVDDQADVRCPHCGRPPGTDGRLCPMCRPSADDRAALGLE